MREPTIENLKDIDSFNMFSEEDILNLFHLSKEQDKLQILTYATNAVAFYEEPNFKLVTKLLNHLEKVDANALILEGPAKGASILWLLVYWKQWDLVEQLIAKSEKADLNLTPQIDNQRGISVLWGILYHENWKLAQKLIAKMDKINVNAAPQRDEIRGISVLWWVVFNEQWGLAQDLIHKADLIDANLGPQEGENRNTSVLYWVLIAKKWDLARKIIEKSNKINVNASCQEGIERNISVLWLAVYNEQWDLVQDLVSKADLIDANLGPKEDKFQNTSVLWWVLSSQKWDLARQIIAKTDRIDVNGALLDDDDRDRGKSVFWFLVFYKQWDLVREIIAKADNIDVNAAPLDDKDGGKSVLWLVVFNKQWDLTRQIIAKTNKIDVNAAPLEGRDRGKNVLWFAVINKQWDLAKELLAKTHTVDINHVLLEESPYGKDSIFWIAVANKQWDLVKELLAKADNVDVNALFSSTHNNLSLLVAEDQREILQTLFIKGYIDFTKPLPLSYFDFTKPLLRPQITINAVKKLMTLLNEQDFLECINLLVQEPWLIAIKTPQNVTILHLLFQKLQATSQAMQNAMVCELERLVPLTKNIRAEKNPLGLTPSDLIDHPKIKRKFRAEITKYQQALEEILFPDEIFKVVQGILQGMKVLLPGQSVKCIRPKIDENGRDLGNEEILCDDHKQLKSLLEESLDLILSHYQQDKDLLDYVSAEKFASLKESEKYTEEQDKYVLDLSKPLTEYEVSIISQCLKNLDSLHKYTFREMSNSKLKSIESSASLSLVATSLNRSIFQASVVSDEDKPPKKCRATPTVTPIND